MNSGALVRRLGAVGLLLAVVGVLSLGGVLPVVKMIEDYDLSTAENEDLLSRSLQIASRRAVLETDREALTERMSNGSSFLQGDSAELIAADLQDQIKQLLGRFGATLNSTQTLAPKDESGYLKVTLRLNMTTDTRALQSIMHALESQSPILFIDNIDLRSGSLRMRRGETEEPDTLQVRFDVYGFVRNKGA